MSGGWAAERSWGGCLALTSTQQELTALICSAPGRSHQPVWCFLGECAVTFGVGALPAVLYMSGCWSSAGLRVGLPAAQ